MDLVNDFRKGSAQTLINMGYNYSSIENAPSELFNVYNMLISQTPRKVVYSKEFSYPLKYEVALDEFVAKVENGEDLMPFLSEKVHQSTNKDGLLNDWGIHHFHLTKRFRSDGIAQRSQYQIFAYVTEETFYMIQVYPHNKDLLYCQQEMIEILHKNWANVIEKYKLQGATNVRPKMTDEMFANARKTGCYTFIQVEDVVYSPIGGGLASDSSSVQVGRQCSYWHNTLKDCEIALVSNMGFLIQDFKSILFNAVNYNFVIRFRRALNNTIHLFEEVNGVEIIFNDINSDKCNMYCRITVDAVNSAFISK